MTKSIKIELSQFEDPADATCVRPACVKCEGYLGCSTPFMSAYVPPDWTGKLLILGEAPGANEDIKGRPFVGKAGDILYGFLSEVGLEPRDVALTNSVRCRPPKNVKPNAAKLRLCRGFAWYEIIQLRPQWVLAMGDTAASALKLKIGSESLSKLRQKCFAGKDVFGECGDGIMVAVTYHPAACLYSDGRERRANIKQDLRWLVEFRGYRDSPPNEEPFLPEQIAIDLEWDTSYKLLTVGAADTTCAAVTEEPEIWNRWFQELLSSSPTLVGHSVFGDLVVARLNQIPILREYISGQKVLDTVLLTRLINENLESYKLEDLSVSMCSMAPWKLSSERALATTNIVDFSQLERNTRMERCRLDSYASAQLAMLPQISSLSPCLVKFTHQVAAALKRVELAGVKISESRYRQIAERLGYFRDERAAKLKSFAALFAGKLDFEPSNDNHFRSVLYDSLGVKPEKFTAKDGKPSVDKKALILIYQSTNDLNVKEAVLSRLRYEKVDKLFTTYVGYVDEKARTIGMLRHITPNWFVHQHINPLGARTGRRSSHDPNMQNWPKRLRSMVISRFKDGTLYKFDYSQLEPRIMAEIAGIDWWKEIFASGKSLYIEVALELWKKRIEKETDEYKITKETILGTNYNMEAPLYRENLQTKLGIKLSLSEASEILERYHRLVPQIRRYLAIQKERLLAKQQVETITGQIRRLPCPDGERTPGFGHLLNQALNFPIQGTAAFVTGGALLDVESVILKECGISLEEHYDNLIRHWASQNFPLDNPLRSAIMNMGREIDYPVIQNEVHDELDVDCPAGHAGWIEECCKEAMEKCQTLQRTFPSTKCLRLIVESTHGVSWAGM